MACHLCGCEGWHACTGAPIPPWTEEDKARFTKALGKMFGWKDNVVRTKTDYEHAAEANMRAKMTDGTFYRPVIYETLFGLLQITARHRTGQLFLDMKWIEHELRRLPILLPKSLMSCEYCTDPDGKACFPSYGIAPHNFDERGLITEFVPKEQWPDNFVPDPEDERVGTYFCPKCGDGRDYGHGDDDPSKIDFSKPLLTRFNVL